jgi:hypothetical protein
MTATHAAVLPEITSSYEVRPALITHHSPLATPLGWLAMVFECAWDYETDAGHDRHVETHAYSFN